MKPLLILILVFLLTAIIHKAVKGRFNFAYSGRLAMAVMLLFTASGHFLYTKGMAMMIPGTLPYKTVLVYATGVMECMLAVGLLLPRTQKMSARLLILLLLLMLPANIYTAIYRIDYTTATHNGYGPLYLLFRIPMQVLLILWVYVFGVLNR